MKIQNIYYDEVQMIKKRNITQGYIWRSVENTFNESIYKSKIESWNFKEILDEAEKLMNKQKQ